MKCVKMLLFGSALVIGLSASVVSAQNTPVAPVAVVQTTPAPSATPEPVVPVAEPAAPPQWAQNLLVTAQKLPVIGPIVSKALVYSGILVSILTALVAFLMTLLSAVSGIASLSGAAGLLTKVQAFKDGKIMYWLKYLSMFNAQAPQPAVIAASTPIENQKAA